MDESKEFTAEDIFNEIDQIYTIFRYSRSSCPYLDPKYEGQAVTVPFNLPGGIQTIITYKEPLTKEFISFNNKVGHFTNQNFIIRLYALLEYYQIIGNNIKIDFNLPGADELDILRRLRKYFAHRSGPYNKDDEKQVELFNAIESHFHLGKTDSDDFPISIDTVLTPIVNKIKEYVKSKFSK